MSYGNYGNRIGVAPEALGGTAGARDYPMIYFRLQQEINRECDDLVNRGVRRLSPEIVNDCVNRIYSNTCNRYPDLAKYARDYENNAPITKYDFHSYGVDVQFAGLFLGLIALLFLAEFAGRRHIRRHIRRAY